MPLSVLRKSASISSESSGARICKKLTAPYLPPNPKVLAVPKQREDGATKSLVDRPEGQASPVKAERFPVRVEDAVQDFQTLLPVHDVRHAAHGLEVAQQVNDNAGQSCPCGFQAVGLDGEGQIFRFDDAVVAAGKLLLQDGGVLGADVVKIIPLRCDLKTFCVLHRVNLAIQKRKLHMDGSIHIVVEVAQVFKDGGLVSGWAS